MIRLERPSVDAALPDVDLRTRYETWRTTKTAGLNPKSALITSRWDQFVRGKGEAKGLGPVILDKVRTWQHHKCVWCESTEPTTIDHLEPKAISPARMFDWDNLHACCGDCNTARSHAEDVGPAQLIVPTRDEPLLHFRWDARTGRAIYGPNDTRARDTERAVGMSRHSGEREQKLFRFRVYLGHLLNQTPPHTKTLEMLQRELLPERPYLCIVRSWLLHPPDEDARLLRDLAFAKEPRLHHWVSPWLRPHAGASWPPAP